MAAAHIKAEQWDEQSSEVLSFRLGLTTKAGANDVGPEASAASQGDPSLTVILTLTGLRGGLRCQ